MKLFFSAIALMLISNIAFAKCLTATELKMLDRATPVGMVVTLAKPVNFGSSEYGNISVPHKDWKNRSTTDYVGFWTRNTGMNDLYIKPGTDLGFNSEVDYGGFSNYTLKFVTKSGTELLINNRTGSNGTDGTLCPHGHLPLSNACDLRNLSSFGFLMERGMFSQVCIPDQEAL